MATMNVSLSEPMKSWIETRLQDGSFSNTNDDVRHLLRRDQEREQAIETMQAVIEEGMKSGAPEPVGFMAFKARMRQRHIHR